MIHSMNVGPQYSMTTYVLVCGNTKVRLWGLDSVQRLRRQLHQIARESPRLAGDIRWADSASDIPAGSSVLLLNGAFLFEVRTLEGVLERPGHLLLHEDGRVAAAFGYRARPDAGDMPGHAGRPAGRRHRGHGSLR